MDAALYNPARLHPCLLAVYSAHAVTFIYASARICIKVKVVLEAAWRAGTASTLEMSPGGIK